MCHHVNAGSGINLTFYPHSTTKHMPALLLKARDAQISNNKEGKDKELSKLK
jgi:hypothetical protein